MAAGDPTFDVSTPRGVLQGVAVFTHDGASWQPQGKAATEVATPTGVLRGVAAFSGGPNWAPVARAQTEVPTPSGVLDGVAVYTWSGSQWTPPSGNIEVATPSGVLEGVAAFDWDGTNWQPQAQAGAEVPTPYGVLTGVARFGWTGSVWAATGAPTLSLDFMTPGQLDSRVTFTRASTATYTDASGVIQTAAVNQPRWDYAGGSLRGLLIEEARTNLILQSGNLGAAPWAPAATGTAPTVTANNAVAPDGTLTAARIVMPAVPAGANAAFVSQNAAAGTVQTTFSIWLRGSAGGEIVNLCATNFVTYAHTTTALTTAWQRFSFTATPATGGWAFFVGADMRDATQTPTPAETFYAWGAQSEAGGFVTSYIPTGAASATRAQDTCAILPANMGWFTSPGGSWFAEFVYLNPAPSNARIISRKDFGGDMTPMFITSPPVAVGQYDGIAPVQTANFAVVNAISKAATTWAAGQAKICVNGGAVATSAALTNGFAPFATEGISFLTPPGNPTSGYLRRVQYWPRVLSSTEMQQVTT